MNIFKQIVILSIFIIFKCEIFAQTMEYEDLSAYTISNIETADFNFLKDILNNKKVIVLSEASHSDASTRILYTPLLQYLKDSLGFKTIFKESSGYAFNYFQNQYEQDSIDFNEFYAKTFSSTAGNLYIADSSRVDFFRRNYKNIQYLGFDEFDVHDYNLPVNYYLKDIESILSESNPDFLESEAWKNIMIGDYLLFDYATIDDVFEWPIISWSKKYFIPAVNKLLTLIDKESHFDDYLRLKNLIYHMEQMRIVRNKLRHPKYTNKDITHLRSERDLYMYKNLKEIIDHHGLDEEKYIVLVSSVHASRDLFGQDDIRPKWAHGMSESRLGNYLFDEYGDAFYSIATMFYEGKMTWGSELYREPNSTEYELAQEIDFGFINLREESNESNKFCATVIGRNYPCDNLQWSNHYDGLFFMKEFLAYKREPQVIYPSYRNGLTGREVNSRHILFDYYKEDVISNLFGDPYEKPYTIRNDWEYD